MVIMRLFIKRIFFVVLTISYMVFIWMQSSRFNPESLAGFTSSWVKLCFFYWSKPWVCSLVSIWTFVFMYHHCLSKFWKVEDESRGHCCGYSSSLWNIWWSTSIVRSIPIFFYSRSAEGYNWNSCILVNSSSELFP